MEPIIVTAFWDVGRGENCAIPRSNDRYYREFKAWAKIKNNLIVFTDSISESIIKKIRRDYGLEKRTQVIVCDDIFQIEKKIYEKMVQIEAKNDVAFKYYENAMSNRAKFDYAWFLKYWCISEASKMIDDNGLIAWMDFGFNHMDACFDNMEQFDFLWDCNVDMNKIHIYSLCEMDSINVIDTLLFQNDTIMGVFHLVPVRYAMCLWNMIKEAMESLLMMQCIDDDQMLLLIAYKNNPDKFAVHISDWYLPLKENGADHLHVKTKNKKITIKQKIYIHKNRCKYIFRCIKRLKKVES